MKITAELIANSPSYINAVKDRELDLRENKIHQIENLGATKDLNDCIDFSNNDLKVLGNFPLLKRLRVVLASNNRIHTIDPALSEHLPNLTDVVLTNNNVADLGEITALKSLKHLTRLSLLDNPVAKKQHYREWVIHNVPGLRVLDFQKVREKEREAAKALFTKAGEQNDLAKSLAESKSKIFEPGKALEDGKGRAVPSLGVSKEEQARIKEAIKNAKTLEEVTHLERLLRTGHVPEKGKKLPRSARNEEEEEDAMEED